MLYLRLVIAVVFAVFENMPVRRQQQQHQTFMQPRARTPRFLHKNFVGGDPFTRTGQGQRRPRTGGRRPKNVKQILPHFVPNHAGHTSKRQFPSKQTQKKSAPRKQPHVRLLKILGLDERLVVARGRGLEAVHQGQIVAVDAHQLALPNAIVQRAWVEVRKRLLGDYCAAEPLSREITCGVIMLCCEWSLSMFGAYEVPNFRSQVNEYASCHQWCVLGTFFVLLHSSSIALDEDVDSSASHGVDIVAPALCI